MRSRLEQKALQALLRAEATFRQIRGRLWPGGGGGAGGGNAGRDLASLFDLELDTEKNQYETAQTASPAEQHEKDVEDALEKLDALAKRQEDLANQQNNPAAELPAALAAGNAAARGRTTAAPIGTVDSQWPAKLEWVAAGRTAAEFSVAEQFAIIAHAGRQPIL